MKLLNRKEFLAQWNVVFSFYNQKMFMTWEWLYIKYQSLQNDFCYCSIFQEIGFEFSNNGMDNQTIAEEKLEKGEEISIDTECGNRDWSFLEEEKYIVYSDKDVQKMIKSLNSVLK